MSLWAQRKAAVAAEEQAEVQARLDAAARAEEQALAERPDAELLAEAGMKPPEELTNAEEVRAFLKHALPDRLKRRALRRLWGLNPVLANIDGLVDYGEDFTDKAMVVENMQTVYSVGKGMLEQFRDLEEQAEVQTEALAANEAPSAQADLPKATEPACEIVAAPVEATPEPAPEPDLTVASRRRMRFSFQT